MISKKLADCYNDSVTDLHPTVSHETIDMIEEAFKKIDVDGLDEQQTLYLEELQLNYLYIVDLVAFEDFMNRLSITTLTEGQLNEIRQQLASFIDLESYYEKHERKILYLEKELRTITTV